MRVVMVAKQKGGSGASTTVRELGVAAAAAGERVVFVDPRSAGYYAELVEPPDSRSWS